NDQRGASSRARRANHLRRFSLAATQWRSNARRESSDVEGSRSLAIEVCAWRERAADRDRRRFGRSTVAEYLRRAAVIGITWPVPEGVSDAEFERRLFTPGLARPASGTAVAGLDVCPQRMQAARGDADVAVGRVPQRGRRWLRLQPVLRSLPRLAQ